MTVRRGTLRRGGYLAHIAPRIADSYAAQVVSHAERGCGDFGLGRCECTCEDHTCSSPPPAPAPVSCATCRGVRFIRTTRDINHPDFGKSSPCPVCIPPVEFEQARAAAAIRGSIPASVVQMYRLDALTDAPVLVRAVRKWIDAGYGPQHWLTLWGERGTGKTHAALSAAREAALAGRSVYVTTAATLLDDIRATFRQRDDDPQQGTDPRRALRSADLVVMDELEKPHQTEWAYSELFGLLDARWLQRKTTIITTNRGPSEVDLRDPLWSRVFGDAYALVLRTSGRDHRMAVRG